MELNDYLSMLSQVLLIIALPIVIAAAIQSFRVQTQKLRESLGEEKFDALKNVVQTAVCVAEQAGIIDQLTGPEKRDKAIEFVQSFLNERNVRVDVGQIADLVEAEVLKQFQNPVAPADTAVARQELIDRAVEAAVLAAEQSGIQGLIQNIGAQKKAYALNMAKEYLRQHGISVPDQLIDGLIEAQVLRFMLAARGQTPTSSSPPQAVG